VDDELLALARREVARQHGLDPDRAHRLVGTTAESLHRDAVVFAREEGVHDPTQVTRDEGGRFAPRSSSAGSGFDMNRAIRMAAGRSA
jgi:hypothetical protein